MLILRNFRNLTKLTQKHVTTVNCALSRRELRRLPSQTADFQSLEQQPEEKEHSPPETNQRELRNVRKQRSTETEQRNQHERLPTISNDEEDHLPSIPSLGENNYVQTFNLAAYVNKSPTLQQLIQLGVDLSQIERRKGLAQFVLGLNFEEDVQPYLLFLQDQGVPAEAYGELITKNPLLFKVDLDDLQTRINYLEAKKFSPKERTRILTMNPFWLMFATRRIDRRLGHFQQEFRLRGDDVRFLTVKQPRLITYNMEHIRKSTFCIREEMGFDQDELKCLLLSKPRLWMMKSDDLIERFAYAHEQMQLSHDMLVQFPEVLISREFRLRQRHEFLKLLGRSQYDPEKDLYVSPKSVVEGTDHQFVQNVAKSDMKTYELFLKTR